MKKYLIIIGLVVIFFITSLIVNGLIRENQSYTSSEKVAYVELNINDINNANWLTIYKAFKYYHESTDELENRKFITWINNKYKTNLDPERNKFVFIIEDETIYTITNFKKQIKQKRHVYTLKNNCNC